jgi:hypothetical protein
MTTKKKKPVSQPTRSSGRPTKLDSTTQQKFIDAVREGLPYSTACALAGIAETTFAVWRQRADAEPESPYAGFVRALKEAEAEAEAANVKRIRSAADNGQWQAAAWILERRHPDKWARTDRTEQQHSGQVEIVVRREQKNGTTKTD